MGRYITLFFHVVLLVILYLFIFRVVAMILQDLRRERAGPAETAKTSGPVAGLVVAGSDDPALPAGRQIGLDRVIYIGRGEENQVNLAGSFASHRHARIIFRDRNYFLEDLGSTNGTYINGVRINDPVQLKDGDLVKVAGVTLRFVHAPFEVRWEHEVE
ncbi:MAG: FHA domain-containing protein [Bacillota bacterium]